MMHKENLTLGSSSVGNGDLGDSELATQLAALSEQIVPDEEFLSRLETELLNAHGNVAEDRRRLPARLFQLPIQHSQRNRQVALLGSLLAIVILLIASPTTRASLMGLFNGLTMIEEQAIPANGVEIIEPILPSESYSATSTAALADKSTRQIPVPSTLPPGVAFTGGWVDEQFAQNRFEVTQVYHPVDRTVTPETPYLLISASTDSDVVPMLPREEAQWVQINGQEALYVRGRWQGNVVSSPDVDSLENIQWNAAADAGWLSWTHEELNILMVADGLQLEQEAMIEIAESLMWQ